MKNINQEVINYSEVLEEALKFGQKFRRQAIKVDFLPIKDESYLDKHALALIDSEGNVHSAGDASERFSMQSICKVLTFLMLLEQKPLDEIKKSMDIKPTALPYNSIIDLELGNRKPRNPMISIGAIATVALLHEIYGEDTFNTFLNQLKNITGNQALDYSREIYDLELSTGYTNIAGIYLMVQAGTLPGNTDIEKVIETYYKCCTVMINTLELAQLGYFLSNDGYDTRKGVQVYGKENTQLLRSIMALSGMYDSSGEFAAEVGLPAKSGIGGGIVACTRSKIGLAAFSPIIDETGNITVAHKSLEYVSKRLNLSIY